MVSSISSIRRSESITKVVSYGLSTSFLHETVNLHGSRRYDRPLPEQRREHQRDD